MAKKIEGVVLKSIESERKGALRDCWEYHGRVLKGETKKADLLNYLFDRSFEGDEDIAFFAGYLRGLDFAEKKVREMAYIIGTKTKGV